MGPDHMGRWHARGSSPAFLAATPSRIVSVLHSHATAVAEDPASGAWLVLHGEVYDDAAPPDGDPAILLLERYLSRGIDAISDRHGSYAILVIDPRRDFIAIATDRIGSRKIFHSRSGDTHWFSTAHAYERHPVSGKPDETAAVQYLVSGVPLRGRTLQKDIRQLNRASVHELMTEGIRSRRYWDFHIDDSGFLGADERELQEELARLLTACIERRVSGCGPVHLSLSGGFDSVFIAGMLSRLGVDDVSCFTYTDDPYARGGDAEVAARTAARLGFDHVVVSGYGAGLRAAIERNIAWGQGATRFVAETEAWESIRSELSPVPRPELYVGDEPFGGPPMPCNEYDGLSARPMDYYGHESIVWLRTLVDASRFRSYAGALESGRDELLARCGPYSDPQDRVDFLYIEERLRRVLAWREFFPGRFAIVHNPFLDGDVLDFMRHVPARFRRGKCLFKRTAAAMFPDLYELGRARTPGWITGNWMHRELAANRPELERWVLNEPSPLDDILPPHVLVELLRDRGRVPRTRGGASRRRKLLMRKVRSRLPGGRAGRGRRYAWIDERVFLLRAIFLRMYFQRRSASG